MRQVLNGVTGSVTVAGFHMDARSLLITLAIGIVAGWVTRKIIVVRGMGLFGDFAVAIAGSFLGVWVFGLLGIAAYGYLGSIIMAVVGRVLVLVTIRDAKNG